MADGIGYLERNAEMNRLVDEAAFRTSPFTEECPVCRMVQLKEHLCKLRCDNCGYMEDCGDAGI